MTRRLLGMLTLAAMTAAIMAVAQSAPARAAGGCDGSGAGSDRLCSGGHLNVNQFLRSANGRYRFYYQGDGHTLIYDTINWDHWDPSVPIFEPHPNASYLMYGVNGSGGATNDVTMWSFTSWHTSAAPYSVHWGHAQGGGHYLKLDDDGCLRTYENDGGYVMTVWC